MFSMCGLEDGFHLSCSIKILHCVFEPIFDLEKK